jgi:prolyl-tRNA synthetase
MVIRPYGYALWEGIQRWMDARFKEKGVENAYFPQLIPYSFITKEASHVEGFAPELAIVTQGGGKELEEPLVVRPTSETIVNHMFSQWIQSYRDLPLLMNQWANVHRWEMRTRPFIRTLEFLWQEGHTAHATAEEAEAMAIDMVNVYREFAEDVAAMPVIVGRKSRVESFAGANCTYTIEAMMGDKRALQAGTSHNLGQNFAKAFDTTFTDEKGQEQFVHQSSWGVSTRLIGGIIMTHGDDAGLRLPPALAPIQVVVVPIAQKNKDLETVAAAVAEIVRTLTAAGVRVKLDDDTRNSPGWKFNHWEMKGVPIRIEVGPKDVAKDSCVLARRDKPGKEGKEFGVPVEAASLVAKVNGVLDEVQAALFREAKAFRDENIVDVASYDELKAAVAAGKWARGGWEGSDEQEKEVKVGLCKLNSVDP